MTHYDVSLAEVWETEVDRYRPRYCVRCGEYLSQPTCVCGLTVNSPEWDTERAKRNARAAAEYDAILAKQAREKWIFVSSLKQVLSPYDRTCARDDPRLRMPRVWSISEWYDIRVQAMKILSGRPRSERLGDAIT